MHSIWACAVARIPRSSIRSCSPSRSRRSPKTGLAIKEPPVQPTTHAEKPGRPLPRSDGSHVGSLTRGEAWMPKNPLADFAPKLVEITEKVLFGDVWERPQLTKRDRSLITCAALVATGKTEQMNFHFPRAIENGVTEQELIELTHLAFYAGRPNAMSAGTKAKELFK